MVLAGVGLPAQAFDCNCPGKSHSANANTLKVHTRPNPRNPPAGCAARTRTPPEPSVRTAHPATPTPNEAQPGQRIGLATQYDRRKNGSPVGLPFSNSEKTPVPSH